MKLQKKVSLCRWLPSGASIILSWTVSPGFMTQLEQRSQSDDKDLKLVDAAVYSGVKRAAKGTLTDV
ncbi:hypothetical protein NL676_029260 [Syzygium grande]|nr:hypothetical protein NL676_029260 [Syzygium grande]